MLTAQLDMTLFNRGMAAVRQISSKTLLEQTRQRTLNVAGRAFDLIPPMSGVGVLLKRSIIKSYLSMPIAIRIRRRPKIKIASLKRHTRIRQAEQTLALRKTQTSFKEAASKAKPWEGGKVFKQKGTDDKQLQRVHLIVQMRNKKAGNKGLYGAEMTKAASKFRGTALKSVGFLKSVFLPVITTLNRICKFKFPFNKTANISRWPGGAGYGSVMITEGKFNPMATMNLEWFKQGKTASDRGTEIIVTAVQRALNNEGREMLDHTIRELQKGWKSHPALQRRGL